MHTSSFFVVTSLALALALGPVPADAGSVTGPDTGLCAVTFSVSTQPSLLPLGGLSFEVDYSSAPGPGFVGSAADVACTDLVGAGVEALNDIDAERVLNAAFIDAVGVDTPLDLTRCIYDTSGESLASSDLSITVIEARTPEFELLAADMAAEVKCFQCGQPFSDGGRPAVTDCLFILRSATALEVCDPDCVCDVNADGDITALDALLCLQDLILLPVELICICDSATTTTTMAPSTTLPPTTTTMPADDCGNGTVDPGEDCDGGQCCAEDCTFSPAETPCGSSENTDCTNPDSCNDAGQCFARNEPNDTPCNTDPCGDAATCQGGLCACPTTTTLPPSTTTTTLGGTDPHEACLESFCLTDGTLRQQCEAFLDECLTGGDFTDDECIGTALFFCDGGACGQDFCAADDLLAQECEAFLDECLAAADNPADQEACVGAAVLKCSEEPIPPDTCIQELCADDQEQAQLCEDFLAACEQQENNEECTGGGLFICQGGFCLRDACLEDEGLEQACRTFLQDCLAAAETQPDVEGCFGASLGKCDNVGCTSDAECDNGVFCDGAEECNVRNQCDDGNEPCGAREICIEEEDSCIEEP